MPCTAYTPIAAWRSRKRFSTAHTTVALPLQQEFTANRPVLPSRKIQDTCSTPEAGKQPIATRSESSDKRGLQSRAAMPLVGGRMVESPLEAVVSGDNSPWVPLQLQHQQASLGSRHRPIGHEMGGEDVLREPTSGYLVFSGVRNGELSVRRVHHVNVAEEIRHIRLGMSLVSRL